MTAIGIQRRDSLAPAILAAAALHVALFAALVLLARPSDLPMGASVPITLVTNGPTTDSRRAEAAPVPQEAQVETPVPAAKSPTPPPAPAAQPAPAPTPPTPIAAEAPAKSKATRAPVKPAPSDTDFLNSLQASIAKATRTSAARPAFAQRGPTRAQTAPEARVDAGSGVSQSDIAGLSELLQRLWNPNCSVDGGDTVIVPVKFAIGDDGRVLGRVTPEHAPSSDPVAFAAARRAIDAVHQAEPYAEAYRGKSFTVNFDAKKACAQR